eukprot:jgi/Botrbrau1/17595/Bobra.0166s0035.1
MVDGVRCSRSSTLPAGEIINGASQILEECRRALRGSGFDIVEPFCLSWYNDSLPEDLAVRIPSRGHHGPKTLCVLVGNTRKLWEPFLETCNTDSDLLNSDHPLDTYVERAVSDVMKTVSSRCRCYWAHHVSDDLSGGPGYVAIQRLAAAIGLAYLDPTCHLCMHPKYGPWFALRCILVFDELDYQGAQNGPVACPLDNTTKEYVRMAMRSAERAASTELEGKDNKASIWDSVKESWRKWVAVRDASFPGHPWRYSSDQLEYHYTRNKKVLASALRERAKARSCPPTWPPYCRTSTNEVLARAASTGGFSSNGRPPSAAIARSASVGSDEKPGFMKAVVTRLTGISHLHQEARVKTAEVTV